MPPTSNVSLKGLFVGSIAELVPGLLSAIWKKSVHDRIYLDHAGLAGDHQADRKHHGGPDRALHHYPAEHYSRWAEELPGFSHLAPGFGENISTLGLTEHDVRIGEVFELGEAVIQITQPRSPCHKLNHRFSCSDMSKRVQSNGRCGWFYRVLEPGWVAPDDALKSVAGTPSLSVADAMAIMFQHPFDAGSYETLRDTEGLSASWRKTLENRLTKRSIESWQKRLFGVTLVSFGD